MKQQPIPSSIYVINGISWELNVRFIHPTSFFCPGYRTRCPLCACCWDLDGCNSLPSLPQKKLLLLFSHNWVCRTSEPCMVVPETPPLPHVGWEKECGLRVRSGLRNGSLHATELVEAFIPTPLHDLLSFSLSWPGWAEVSSRARPIYAMIWKESWLVATSYKNS